MAARPQASFKSLFGKYLGLGSRGELVVRGPAAIYQATRPAVTATISISAEGASVANQRDITITLKDNNGKAIDYAEVFEIVVFSSSAMTDFVATGGSTGIAQGSGGNTGKILALVAKKVFRAISDTSGVIAVIYTDTGTEAVYLGVRLPNGEVVGIGALTNA